MFIYWGLPKDMNSSAFMVSSSIYQADRDALVHFSKAEVWGCHGNWGGHRKDTWTCSQSYSSGLKWVKGIATLYPLPKARTLLVGHTTTFVGLSESYQALLLCSLLQLIPSSLALVLISLFPCHSGCFSLSTNWWVGLQCPCCSS